MPTAKKILENARRSIAQSGDDKEGISLEDARILKSAGAKMTNNSRQADGTHRIDLEFRRVCFVTVTPHRVEL